MNYTVDGKYYIANDGYFFRSKDTGIISKTLRLKTSSLINDYEVVKVFIASDGILSPEYIFLISVISVFLRGVISTS